ncbi:MAG: helix-turn-helix transcriptional regulator, partial [Muribaculaceae bacterium]|nr:helix-turn-helix transcriptional regulator [Muribaculaceae bacterium]
LNNTKQIKINPIHIGKEIESRMHYLRLSKSEFGRKIGIPQQNVNRILGKESIDTDKLVRISEALNYNFFALFCNDESDTSSCSEDTDVQHPTGTADLAAIEKKALIRQLTSANEMIAEKERTIKILMSQLKIDVDK